MEKLTISARKGTTLDIPIRIESDVVGYVQITGMSNSAPLRVTTPSHGIPDGWRVGIMNAGGMTELNAENFEGVSEDDLRRISVVDANHIDFPGVNSTAFSTYTSGGQLVFYKPKDLSVYANARMDVKDRVGGNTLVTFNVLNDGLRLDNPNSALWLHIEPVDLSSINVGNKVFDVEMVRNTGEVDALCSADSVFEVLPEITTSS